MKNISYNNEKITVEWDEVPGTDSYDITRAGSRLGNYSFLGNVKENSFTDSNPNKNKYENYYKITPKNGKGDFPSFLISFELLMFGENVKFYDIKYDSISEIEKEINFIHDNEMFGGVKDSDGRTAEFSKKRYAFYFKSGKYEGFESFKIGFYTHAAGLGLLPSETKLSGTVETPPHLPNNNATCTFWRSIENFEVNGGKFLWGVSQAAPLRRMKINVPCEFDWKGGWASGGFNADCFFNDNCGSVSQQQWYARNSHFEKGFSGVNWNKVIQASTGKIEEDNWNKGGCSTDVEESPLIREKPFLCIKDGKYKVFVPALKQNAKGISWKEGDPGEGKLLDIEDDFYIAKAETDTAQTINEALGKGKNIFFTPGRYELSEVLHVKRKGSVLLGTGLATLIPGEENSKGAIFIEDEEDITVCGLMFDALYSSSYLLCEGEKKSSKKNNSPLLLADLFFRIGGYREENVNVEKAVLINSNNTIGDHFWVWRADHGMGVGWEKNICKNGIIVNGDDVIFYGLFVEHFHEYQTLWTGEEGRMYFYQSETPYDPLEQSVYKSHDGKKDGWASYKVDDNVKNHLAVGLGVYAVFITTGHDRKKSVSVVIDNAIEVPDKPNVKIKHACIINLSGEKGPLSGIRSIVNGKGKSALGAVKREYLVNYCDGSGD